MLQSSYRIVVSNRYANVKGEGLAGLIIGTSLIEVMCGAHMISINHR